MKIWGTICISVPPPNSGVLWLNPERIESVFVVRFTRQDSYFVLDGGPDPSKERETNASYLVSPSESGGGWSKSAARPLWWASVGASSFIQCFDAVVWVT